VAGGWRAVQGRNFGRACPTFEALPYYDEDGSNNLDLLAKVKAELAKEQKRIGQRVAADNDPRIPPQFPLFSVCHFKTELVS
jgi:hypothetical protein